MSDSKNDSEVIAKSRRNVSVPLYIIGFLDMLGVGLIIPLMTKQITYLTSSNTAIGFIVSLYGGLQMFSSPAIGSWSDIAGRKRVLMIVLLMSALSYFIVGLSLYVGGLWMFLLGRIIAGIFKHTQTLVQAFTTDMMSKTEGAIAFSLYNTWGSIGFVVGPVVGSQLADVPHGFFIVCCLSAFLFLICIVIVTLYIPSSTFPVKTIIREFNSFKKLKSLLKQVEFKYLWDILLLRLLLGLATLFLRDSFIYSLDKKYGIEAKSIGYVIAFQATIKTITGFFIPPLMYYFKSDSILFYSIILEALCFFFVTVSSSMVSLLLILCPLAFTHSVNRVAIMELFVTRTPHEQIGTVVGLSQSSMSSARMVTPILSGILLDLSVMGPGFAATTTTVLALLLCFYIILYRGNLNTKIKQV